jgi:hypothetical protein
MLAATFEITNSDSHIHDAYSWAVMTPVNHIALAVIRHLELSSAAAVCVNSVEEGSPALGTKILPPTLSFR